MMEPTPNNTASNTFYLAPNQGVAARVVQSCMQSNIAEVSESHASEYGRNQSDTRSDLMAPIQLDGRFFAATQYPGGR